MARDGGDRLLTDDELDGYGDAGLDEREIGDGSANEVDENGERLIPKKKKKKPSGPKKNARKVKKPAPTQAPVTAGLAGRMNGM